MGKQKNRLNFIVGISLVSFALLLVIVGIFYTPYDPNEMNVLAKNQAPSLSHLFGTDYMGRDILSRVMEGAFTTFFVGIATVIIGATIGSILGAVTGYFGGIVDEILMRINDAVASFPSILLALVFVSILGTGKYNVILALGILFIPSFARVIRSEFIIQKEMDYVKSASLLGASHIRIIFLHIFPNTKAILRSAITIGFNNAVLAEAGMSYLSLGVQPPDASLGRMLSESQTYLFGAPWMALAPGLMIVITVLGFSLLNEGGAWHE
ncbi:ABC transporter permease [Lachnoclostridium phytofermentans]|uniref:ABC transporter permease n=1 Tax=Lachnoclostridium phytofermentans TaxID=66219 RepID=UPI0004964370|nr:ABC transporter permease [Lachnoclostridium phytofermentans]